MLLRVFEIAEKIERNSAKSYRRAAELFDDSRTRNMFLRLGDWETTLRKYFEFRLMLTTIHPRPGMCMTMMHFMMPCPILAGVEWEL